MFADQVIIPAGSKIGMLAGDQVLIANDQMSMLAGDLGVVFAGCQIGMYAGCH